MSRSAVPSVPVGNQDRLRFDRALKEAVEDFGGQRGTMHSPLPANATLQQLIAAHNELIAHLQNSTPVPVVEASPWIAPAFVNSWVNYDGGWAPAGYYKDALGIVHLRGLIKNGTFGTVCFTLPAGFIPSGSEMFVGFAANTTPTYASNRFQIDPNGAVTVTSQGISGTAAFQSISATWRAAQ